MNAIFRFYFIVLFSLIASSVFIAFAYSNNNSGERRGEGVSEISGWMIKNVNYAPKGNDPTRLSAVDFDLDSVASRVWVKLTSSSESYFPCTNVSGNHWNCTVTGVSIANMDELRVVATGQ